MDPILKTYILDHAPSGMCDPGITGVISADSVDDLLNLYKQHIDFSLSEDFPSSADLAKYGGDELERHGIYIGSTIPDLTITDKGFLVLLESCKAQVQCKGFSASEIYVKHTSQANISVQGSAFVQVDVFDSARVEVSNTGIGRVTVNVYGNAVVKSSGQVKVVYKHKKTY
jgi:hypothetical protein